MPHYIMFEEDEDFGEAKYNAGEINENNHNLKAYVAQCQAYKDAGVRVMFNWAAQLPMRYINGGASRMFPIQLAKVPAVLPLT